MSLYIGQHKAKVVHIGEDMIKRVYLGNAIVYQYDLDVSATLVGCSATLPTSIYYGESLTATLTPNTGYQMLPWNTVITMGGTDITATAYNPSTNSISIAKVTGDISITAEAVQMSSDYVPVEYIRGLSNGNSGYFNTSIKTTEKSKVKMVFTKDSQSGKYTIAPYRTDTAFLAVQVRASSADTNINFLWNKQSVYRYYTPPYGAIIKAVCDKGAWTIQYDNTVVTGSFNTEGVTFTDTANLCFMGNGFNAGGVIGKFFRFTYWEDDVLTKDYVPALNNTTGLWGVYDVINNSFISKANNLWIGPYVAPTRTYTGCAATLLSGAATGTAAYAVIGSTWSIKITPSSGYTFTGGGTTPQVEIDGVDVTSTTVTDNGDGTYTVTIVDVADKPIEITAACVADPNAVQSNSLLTGTPTNTPDEPMGDNSDEEEM